MRNCPDCQERTPEQDFSAFYCKKCHNRRNRESRARNGGARRYHLRRRYGLEPEQVEMIVRSQGGKCAVCEIAPATQIDHCHSTGTVRGVLCLHCNAAMGAFQDDPELIRAAISYLEAYGD